MTQNNLYCVTMTLAFEETFLETLVPSKNIDFICLWQQRETQIFFMTWHQLPFIVDNAMLCCSPWNSNRTQEFFHFFLATNNVCKISKENIFKHIRLHINTSIIFYEICWFVLTAFNQQNMGTITLKCCRFIINYLGVFSILNYYLITLIFSVIE